MVPVAPSAQALVTSDTTKRDLTKSDISQFKPTGPISGPHPHPSREEVEETMAATMEALSKVVDRKLAATNPKQLCANAVPDGPSYIKYTPKQTSAQHNSGLEHRVIQMQEMAVDPLEPPKFRHQKVPKVPDMTPIPLLHSPPKAVTKEDQANWKIPPCVSAWKNNKGYTIPLDKRLAADGRGMQEESINRKHMSLAHALYAAEEQARHETEMQARFQTEMKQRAKQKKEEQLRNLAAQARMGGAAADAPTSMAARMDTAPDEAGASAFPPPPERAHSGAFPPPPARAASRSHSPDNRRSSPPPRQERLSREEEAEKRARDELRRERQKEREREFRLEEKARSGKRSKLTRDRDRDVGEKVALGQANVGGSSREVQYDSRLFNRDHGVGAGFVGEEDYNVYDKALFTDRSAMSMYRAKDVRDSEVYGGGDGGGRDVDTGRFRADKGFAGTDAGEAGPRTGPVQFEKGKGKEADPFGIDSFLGGSSGGR